MSTNVNNDVKQPAVKAIPEGMHSLTPHLICADAAAAIDFYKRAFGAVEVSRIAMADGKLMHAMLRIGNSALMLMDENPAWGAMGPSSLPNSPVGIHIYVEDVDAAYAHAVEQGATPKMPPADTFWGDRFSALRDPFGHGWTLATHIRDVSPEEAQAASLCMENGG
jgi:PhnB protein